VQLGGYVRASTPAGFLARSIPAAPREPARPGMTPASSTDELDR
jgi:hypothetical protein